MFSKFSKWNKKIDPSARRIYTVMVTDVFPIISHRLPVTFFLWLMPSISIRPANFFLHLPYSRKPLPTLFPDRTHKGIQTFRERETRQVDFSSRSWKKRKRKRRKKETKNSSSWIPRRGKEKREGRNDRGRNSDIFLRPESWSRDSLSLSLSLCFNELNTRGGRRNDRHREKNWIFRLAGCVTVRTETTSVYLHGYE